MNRFLVVIIPVLFLFFNSCQFSENIYINANGSGKMEFSFDGTEFMKLAGDKIPESRGKSIYSTFSFKELFNSIGNSISKLSENEHQKLKSLESFNMHMVMNPETSEMDSNCPQHLKQLMNLKTCLKP